MALMDTIQREILEERLEQEMEALSQEMYGKRIAEISDKDLYYVILNLTKGMMSATIPTDGKKRYIIFPQNSLSESCFPTT